MMDSIRDELDFYILGLPIDTDIGYAHFIKVKEYPKYYYDLAIMSLSKAELVYKYTEINKNGELDEFIKEINKHTLFELSVTLPELANAYYNIFLKVFGNEEALMKINSENFDYYRKLILKMNGIKEKKINPNPEIQKFIEMNQRVKSQESGKLTFTDIITSCVGFNGLSYSDINEFTIFQLYMTFYRIAQIKNYDTSTLFATVSADKVKIDSWSKHIDLFAEDEHFMNESSFSQIAKAVSN